MNSLSAFALEFGESPRIQSLTPTGPLPPRSESFLIAPGGSSAMTLMMRTCRALQEQFEQPDAADVTVQIDYVGSLKGLDVASRPANLSAGAHFLAESERSTYLKHLKLVVLESYEEVKKLAEEGALWNAPDACTFLYSSAFSASRSTFRAAVRASELEAAVAFLRSLNPQIEHSDTPDVTVQTEKSSRGVSLARKRRDEILAQGDWLTAEQVHEAQGGLPDAKGINNAASRLRRSRKLLGVWTGREFLHPSFQYRADTGLLMPQMGELLKLLPDDDTGWRQTFWLFQKHAKLPGSQRPADVFQSNPTAVLEAAKSDFQVSDSSW